MTLTYLMIDGHEYAVPNTLGGTLPAAEVHTYRVTRAGDATTARMTARRAEAHVAAGRVCVRVEGEDGS